jgi:MarR family transcriptional regulator, lower aerobic nicotinate degradation pathway regulator
MSEQPLEQTSSSPPDSLIQSPGFMLAWVADIATRDYTQALATIGIKPQHLGILTLLAGEGPMVQARLGDRLRIVKPAIVGLVNELEDMHLIERRTHPSDGRAFEVHLLKAGLECIEQAKSVSESATAAFFADLNPNEQRSFHEALSKLASAHMRHKFTDGLEAKT